MLTSLMPLCPPPSQMLLLSHGLLGVVLLSSSLIVALGVGKGFDNQIPVTLERLLLTLQI